MKTTLKGILSDILRVRKIISRQDLKQICRAYGYEESNGERRMRSEVNPVPHIKLNCKKKPCQTGEHIEYYKWTGGETKFKKDYEQTRTETRQTQLEEKPKVKRKTLGTRKKRMDSGAKSKTKRKNVTRKKVS